MGPISTCEPHFTEKEKLSEWSKVIDYHWRQQDLYPILGLCASRSLCEIPTAQDDACQSLNSGGLSRPSTIIPAHSQTCVHTPKLSPIQTCRLDPLPYSHIQAFACGTALLLMLFSNKLSSPTRPFLDTQQGGLPPTLELQ